MSQVAAVSQQQEWNSIYVCVDGRWECVYIAADRAVRCITRITHFIIMYFVYEVFVDKRIENSILAPCSLATEQSAVFYLDVFIALNLKD